MQKKISISQIKDAAQEAFDLYKTNTDGKNADYIPYLANINKNLFGISICLLNGQTIQLGDTEYKFGIESVSKVHTAILVLRQYGAHNSSKKSEQTPPDYHLIRYSPFYWKMIIPPHLWSTQEQSLHAVW